MVDKGERKTTAQATEVWVEEPRGSVEWRKLVGYGFALLEKGEGSSKTIVSNPN